MAEIFAFHSGKTVVQCTVNQPLLFRTEHSSAFHTKPGLKVDLRCPEVHCSPALNNHLRTGGNGCRRRTIIDLTGYEYPVLKHHLPSRTIGYPILLCDSLFLRFCFRLPVPIGMWCRGKLIDLLKSLTLLPDSFADFGIKDFLVVDHVIVEHLDL